ncbi:hypothetical protein ESOMN_v1c02760 [Williamsoniiplasma somnilux]|uniref:Uncharacterized protein n=1 Tax=Williamsoniiplasma somnilux TaxID=215578 RepID=A0A2K8NZL5_9MOLU|nr:hypothetical protein [Williamsoniiplasma somnilux]ATZ18658.1 hypothetical protein ESOMN_v1c02760 [Williamsoniiplasma somnilux]
MKKENSKVRSKLKYVLILLILFITIATISFVVLQLSQKNIKNISEIKNELQTTLNNKLNSKWDVNELQKEVDNKWGTKQITVKFISTSDKEKTNNYVNNYMNIFERKIHNDTYSFIGNASKENNFIYSGSINLIHSYSDINNNLQPITKINDDLQKILDEKTNQAWTFRELQARINKDYGDGSITVEELETTTENFFSKTTEWKFIGNGTLENTFPYEGSTILKHKWDDSLVSFIDITLVEQELNEILQSNHNSEWDKWKLEEAIVESGLETNGGITVEKIRSKKTRSSIGGPQQTTWEFTGNANENNDFMFEGKMALVHNWNDKIDTTQDISDKEIVNRLQIILNLPDYKTKSWNKNKLEQAIVDAKIDIAGGITVEEVETVETTRSSIGGPHITIWKFIGHGKESNNWKYWGTINLNHEWNNKKDTTKPISNIKVELKAMVNSTEYKNKAWIQDDLQMAVNKKWAGAGITVSQKNISSIHLFEEKPQVTTWIFTGNGTINNNLPYKDSVEIIHNWVELIPETQDIELIKDELTLIINMEKDKTWSKIELQSEVDITYGVGEITVIDQNEAIKGRSSEIVPMFKTWIFKGNDTAENQLKYSGETSAIHSWTEKIDTSIDISTINDKLNILVNDEAHKDKPWTLEELQNTVNSKFNDGEIEVQIKIKNSNFVDNNEHDDTYVFIGKGNIDNSYKYKGLTEVTHIWTLI